VARDVEVLGNVAANSEFNDLGHEYAIIRISWAYHETIGPRQATIPERAAFRADWCRMALDGRLPAPV
jgi:hypothetical protein